MEKKGRPTKFKKEYNLKLQEHMSKGLSFFSFAAVVDVNQDTLYAWEDRYPSFSEAKKRGRELQRLFYEKIGINAMLGRIKGFNATAFVWQTKNMLNWRDKQDVAISGSAEIRNTQVNLTMSEMVKNPEILKDLITLESKFRSLKPSE